MKNQIEQYALALLAGEIVEIPTETVMGLAVSLDSQSAIQKLMDYKEREFGDKKIFTLVPESKSAIKNYVEINQTAKRFIKDYLPGEITIILPKNPKFNNWYFNHFDTIGIRIPNYDIFPELLKKAGPLLLTSANKKGGQPKTLTGHKPSTVVDLTGKEPKILRQGNLVINL